jgi:hypothetical protein
MQYFLIFATLLQIIKQFKIIVVGLTLADNKPLGLE